MTTQDFIALAERVSGQQLDQFFQAWLFEEGRPSPGSAGRSAHVTPLKAIRWLTNWLANEFLETM